MALEFDLDSLCSNTVKGIYYSSHYRILYINRDGLWPLVKEYYMAIASSLLEGALDLPDFSAFQKEFNHLQKVLGVSGSTPPPSKNYEKLLEFFVTRDWNDDLIDRIFKKHECIQGIVIKDDDINKCESWFGNTYIVQRNEPKI